MSVVSEKQVKAKKKHECCLCGRGIRKGVYYFKQVTNEDGEIGNSKTCEQCMRILKLINEFYNGDFWGADGITQNEYLEACDEIQKDVCENAVCSAWCKGKIRCFDGIETYLWEKIHA